MNMLKSLPAAISITIASMMVIVSCGDEKTNTVADITDMRNIPTMLTTDVSTYVSDSGYTRYHITAPMWCVYEEADTPHWTFPNGMNLEKYDDDMNIDATFRADSATYLSSRKLWRFDGNVNMRNTDGDRFATQQLFWDQNSRKVYSDSFMHIERSERIIEGYGFDSNEAMTEYTILHPQMILPIDRMKAEREERRANDTIQVKSDTMKIVTSDNNAQAQKTPQKTPQKPVQKTTSQPTSLRRKKEVKPGNTHDQTTRITDFAAETTEQETKQIKADN